MEKLLDRVLEERTEKNVLSAEEIAEILPHRYPFALVDRVEDFEPGSWAVGRKCVSMDEPFFQGHFPGKPIMPGVLIIEALAQTGAIAALSLPENKGKIALFGGIKNARFKKPVVPGDVLELRCQMVRQKGPIGVAEAQALVDGKTVAKTEITFSII
ncbi:MAG: 3-hydroxyacyl-ACP dehydratase FabZ [Lachnospiraceae bacterium]|nr:3-hydroxyacyl-ACP dehydratase FabZ [Lachnospiraceae bacterium]